MKKNVTVVFDEPQELGGKEVKEVVIRRPKFKDVRLASGLNDEVAMQNQLIRTLSGIDIMTDEELDEMWYDEYDKLQKAIEGFLS